MAMDINDDGLEISRQMNKQNRDERLARDKGMLRLYTIAEEDILRKGLEENVFADLNISDEEGLPGDLTEEEIINGSSRKDFF